MRSLGSFYERPGTPVCPHEVEVDGELFAGCVDSETGERSRMREIGPGIYECPNLHTAEGAAERPGRLYPDVPRDRRLVGEVLATLDVKRRRSSAPQSWSENVQVAAEVGS